MAGYPSGRSFVQAAVDAVLKAGLLPVDMGFFPAQDAVPAEYCQRRVRSCDVYLAVVGFRYGSLVPDRPDRVSYTELEFLTATEAGMSRLVFVLDETARMPRRLVDRDRRDIAGFRRRLHSANLIVKAFSTPAELGEAVLHALFETRLTQLGGDPDPSRLTEASQRRPWMAPPLERMVERPDLGGRLLAALSAPEAAEVGLTTGLRGAGGFGKTRLATWACHQAEINQRYPGGLLWVAIGQEVHGADLAERVNDLAFVLSRRRPAIFDPDAAGAELGRLLDEREPVLLVVDDVWEQSQLRPFRFGGRSCTRLVTTRVPDVLPANAQHIRVDAMSGEQARQLVAIGLSALRPATADQLATVAGRWPVLLNLVNGALRRRVSQGQPLALAAEEITRRLLAEGPAALDPARPADRTRAVAATIDASLNLLDAADRQRFLDLAIFPEDVDVPLDVLGLLWPGLRLDALCDEMVNLGLVADYRLDEPGPRLALHDVMRSYLYGRCGVTDRVDAHRRLVAAATKALPAHDEQSDTPWWLLPADAAYLWRFLPHHLHRAGMPRELAALVCDLRWVEAKTRRFGSVVGAEADLHLVHTPTASALRQALGGAAHLLGPIEPPAALGATLASRLTSVRELAAVVDSYVKTLARPRLEPARPFPDQADGADASAPAGGHTGAITSCAFSPDGTVLATTSDDGTVRTWQVGTGAERMVLIGHTAGVWSCAFSPDGTLLATVSDDRTVRIWQEGSSAGSTVLAGHTDSVWSCAFSPDGSLVASTSDDRSARIWRVDAGTEQAVHVGHTGGVRGCAFSPDGAQLATASLDGTVRLWSVANGTEVATLADSASSEGVWGCAYSPDGTLVAATGRTGNVYVWHVATATLRAVLTGHVDWVWSCAFSPDGTLLATAGQDESVRLWNVSSSSSQTVLSGHTSWVRHCAFSPDGTLLATASHDQTVRLWQVASGAAQTVLASRTSRMWGCGFSPDGTIFATAGHDRTARLWQVAAGAEHAVLSGHTGRVQSCVFSPDGTLLATTSHDSTARLWHVASATGHAVLTGHAGWVWSPAFSPDGTVLATASQDGTARLWHVATGTPKMLLAGHTGRVRGCAFSPDGSLVATASNDRTARLWGVASGIEFAVLAGHTDWVRSCTFSPDGSLLATASNDRTARLWDIARGQESATLLSHPAGVWACAFSPDGLLLATACADRVVRLWDVASGRCHCALRVSGPLFGIAWHPDGTMLGAVGGAGKYMLTYRR